MIGGRTTREWEITCHAIFPNDFDFRNFRVRNVSSDHGQRGCQKREQAPPNSSICLCLCVGGVRTAPNVRIVVIFRLEIFGTTDGNNFEDSQCQAAYHTIPMFWELVTALQIGIRTIRIPVVPLINLRRFEERGIGTNPSCWQVVSKSTRLGRLEIAGLEAVLQDRNLANKLWFEPFGVDFRFSIDWRSEPGNRQTILRYQFPVRTGNSGPTFRLGVAGEIAMNRNFVPTGKQPPSNEFSLVLNSEISI